MIDGLSRDAGCLDKLAQIAEAKLGLDVYFGLGPVVRPAIHDLDNVAMV
jgi:hypothetical protein